MSYVITPIGDPLTSSVATAKTYSLPAGANAYWVQALTQNIRISLTSAIATASTGLMLKAGDPVRLLRLGGGGSFSAIQETATAVFYCQPVHITFVDD